MFGKVGEANWTVAKLLSIILLVVFLALVVYGISINGLNPLIDRAGGMVDSVLLLFGYGDEDVEGVGDCGVPFSVNIDGVGRGMLTSCRGYCTIKFDEAVGDMGKNFKLDTSRQPFTFRSDHLVLEEKIVNLEEVNKKRDVYPLLRDSFYSVIRGEEISGVPLSEDNSDEMEKLMGRWEDVFYLKVVHKGEDELLLKYEIGVLDLVDGEWLQMNWSEFKDGKWNKRDWSDTKVLDEVYSASYNFFGDKRVYWRIGERYEGHESISGSTLLSEKVLEVKDEDGEVIDYTGVDDWKYEDEAYRIIPGMTGDIGEIDSGKDFRIFNDWFEARRREIKNNYDNKIERLRAFDKQFEGATVNFDGEDYNLLFESDEDRPLMYIYSSPLYGLMYYGDVLFLAESSGGIEWEVNKEMDDVALINEDWEEVVLINKIYNLMEKKCP